MPVRTRSSRNLAGSNGTSASSISSSSSWSPNRRSVSVLSHFSHLLPQLQNVLAAMWDSYYRSDSEIKRAQLIRLGEHKYSAVDTSWLDDLCMKRFWDGVVQLYPMWLAPNLITLIGLVINLLTVLVLSHFCFSATETAPSWAYLLAAFGLFAYQTLDATDGKQARRTNSASPLGELFDHGCDSMTQGGALLLMD